MPNRLSQFWQELKRRNVVRVITVYTGAAFVILSLVDMIREPFELPNWSFKLVVVILAIGLIIAVILSWIYDIHPEGGMVKTEPADKIKTDGPTGSSKGWKIASYISFVVIVGLIVLNIVPREKGSNNIRTQDKSIAVLPLDYLSENPAKEYLANGVLDAITGHLAMIEGLRVMPRTSVEQYRDNNMSAKEIGAELDVSYLIYGSFLMVDDQVKLSIQLVLAQEGDHIIFNKEYDREYKDIFAVQSEVAQTIAKEIEVVITPEEKQRIENKPTTNLTAYDLYQRGREEHWKYTSDRKNTEALERAEYFFNEALKYDSTFALAYTGLARVNWESESYFSESYLDTARVLLEKALTFNPELVEAHTLYGSYFNEINDTRRAMREVDKALSINPNHWEAYSVKATIGSGFINQINNRQKAVLLNRGPELPKLLSDLANSYWNIGFQDKAADTYKEVLKLTGDSIGYFHSLGASEVWNGNINAGITHFENAFALDSANGNVAYTLYMSYTWLDEKEQALKYGKIWMEHMNVSGKTGVYFMHRTGYYYWLKGLEEEADYYFNLQIDYGLREIELKRDRAERDLGTYYDLAATYAFTGETEKALESLRIYISRPVINLFMLGFLKFDPLFNSIRDNHEFREIVREAEDNYNQEHERVKHWLLENNMLRSYNKTDYDS